MAGHMTEAEARLLVEYAVVILNEYEKYLTEATQTAVGVGKLKNNFQAHADLLIESAQACDNIGGESHHELELGVHNALSSFRSGLVGVKSQAATLLAQPLRVLARWHGFIETNPTAIIAKLSEYYRESGRRIQKRGLTVNAASAGRVDGSSNTADSGTIYTCSTDENGDPIDNLWPETTEFKCVSDEHSGATEHNEAFTIEGEPAHPAGLKITGSGATSSARAVTPSSSILLNPSFTAYGSSKSAPVFTNWIEGGSGVIEADTDTYYRDSMGETAPVSVEFTSDATLTQAFSVRRLQLNTNVPYYWHLAFKPSSGASGNLSVKIGNQAARTVAFNGGSGGDVWTIHHERFWFSQVNTESPSVVITVASLSGGTIHIDDFIMVPMSSFNNLYYCIIGGAKPFLREDRFTITIDDGATGLVNEWLWKAFNMYLPCETSPGSYTEGTSGSNPTSTAVRDWIDPAGYD